MFRKIVSCVPSLLFELVFVLLFGIDRSQPFPGVLKAWSVVCLDSSSNHIQW